MDRIKDLYEKNTYTIGIVAMSLVLVLTMVLLWNWYTVNSLFYQTIAGMWMASASFCARSGIDGMMLYVGPDLGGMHKGYLIMYSDTTVVVSHAVEIRFGWSIPSVVKTVITKTMYIKTQDPEESLDEIMPGVQTITLDLSTGCMGWTALDDDNEIRQYAEFYRDNITSSGASSESSE